MYVYGCDEGDEAVDEGHKCWKWKLVNRSREITEMDVDSSREERKGLCCGYGLHITKMTVMKKT